MSGMFNEIAGAVETVLEAITGLHVYSEPVEDPHAPAAEVILNGASVADSCGGVTSEWTVEISVPTLRPDWSRASIAVRDYLAWDGAVSVPGKLKAAAQPSSGSALVSKLDTLRITAIVGERRVEFSSGPRIVGNVNFTVEAKRP